MYLPVFENVMSVDAVPVAPLSTTSRFDADEGMNKVGQSLGITPADTTMGFPTVVTWSLKVIERGSDKGSTVPALVTLIPDSFTADTVTA